MKTQYRLIVENNSVYRNGVVFYVILHYVLLVSINFW